jgi:hypothetical protein
MTTALTLITSAHSTLGVKADGQPLSAGDAQLGLQRLNDLLDSWAIETLYAFSTTEYTGTATGSTVTIGPAGTIVTPYVPTRIEGAFTRDANMDSRIDLVTYQEFADISLKSITGPTPRVGHYDSTGNLFLYPVPSSAEIHVSVYERLDEFATLATDYTFRPGVRRALQLSLAEELAPDYATEMSRTATQLAFRARRALKRHNHVVPQLGSSFETINLYPPGFSGDNYDGAIDPT